ncbi:MAG TPA: 2-amino-4-hydroxy-6-hydroxymethyldihydropteridine diphosphokinase [Mycobacteriales bacterium]|nr:2-amino-4-hydroxy-6-hydroxymethyldihydropteridine diphosphokinase [Mycobacteriales bacterium]
MRRVVWSIGSNVGDRLAHLQSAVDAIAGRGAVVAVSPVYETDPWGPVDQDDFLNAVVISESAASPEELLTLAGDIEQAAARTRPVRWGPRTLDVDLVVVGDEVRTTDALTLPHPRAAERAFVLVPWAAADPAARLAGVPVAELLGALPGGDVDGVRRTDHVLRTS